MKKKILGGFLLVFSIAIFLMVFYYNSSKRQIPLLFSPKEMLGGIWNSYKDTYLEPLTKRTIDRSRNDLTTSEGQSYTMLRAVWMGDKKTFDESSKWLQNNLKHKNDNLHSWFYGKKADGSYGVLTEEGGENSASDADSDIALAYIFAYSRWNDQQYLDRAILILNDIWSKEVVYVLGKPYLVANDVEKKIKKDLILINPSYFSPYAYRIFQVVDPKHPWIDLVSSSYDVIEKSIAIALDKEKSAGLPPDWILLNKKNGKIEASEHEGQTTNYGFDAMRVPWRVALDLEWFGEVRAKKILLDMAFLSEEWKKNASLASGYSHDGKKVLPLETPAFYGANIGFFKTINSAMAEELYEKKLLVLYNPDRDSWEKKLSYYDDNWAWFGLALYHDELPNLFHEDLSQR